MIEALAGQAQAASWVLSLTAVPCRRAQRVRVVAAVAAVEAPATPAVLSKYLVNDLGWDEAWVDTIVVEIKKRRLPTTIATCEAAVS